MNSLQLKASNPAVSTWVSASAGTGKTKILTDRVLRLLLGGAAFDKILCLTFTNAAAGEMKERIAFALSLWSSASVTELEAELYKTMGRKASLNELSKAQQLYGLYLKSSERINIQTIHSFCQKLLKKFPIEAGISPSFKIIDEAKSHSILQQIKKNLLHQSDLEPINEYLTMNFHELTIDEILGEIVQYRTKFLDNPHIVNNLYDESLKIISALQRNYDNNYDSVIYHPMLQDIMGVNMSVAQIKKFFLTTTGQKKKRIVPKKIAALGSNLYSDLERLQQQVFQLDQADRSRQLEAHSKLLSMLGDNILKNYEIYKTTKGLVDYDDLIIYANKLLKSSEAKEWVLYKLDGGIDHLLVDEAQDTSSTQWQIVEAMIEEFYAGDAANSEKNRTVFVVGDEKQSIFSFQGADVSSFARMNKLLKSKMTAGGRKFEDINLEISYRSAKEILDVVFHVFGKINSQTPQLFTQSLTELTAFRSKHSGCVELWPLCSAGEKEKNFWKVPQLGKADISTKTELAKRIGLYIKNQIVSGRVLPSTGRPIAPGDFMLLFRRRDEFTLEVIKALKEENLEVAGLDRICLEENLVVLDLLSVGKFVVNVHDDLNLAVLLKSPLIGIDEQKLYEFSTTRNDNSIWEHLHLLAANDKLAQECCSKLQVFIELFHQSNVSTFFQYVVDILGYRSILNAACGESSNDAIDELLYACSDFASQNNTSIQNFIFWLEGYNTSIKRDNTAADKIRIMTLHASKGLQSPFVILCDTTSVPTNTDRFIWDQHGKTLSAKSSDYTPDYYLELKADRQEKAYAEYLRLLYVGMTRAEDHLIVCGYQNDKALPENCWYQLVRMAMTGMARENEDGSLIYGQVEADDKSHHCVIAPSSSLPSSFCDAQESTGTILSKPWIPAFAGMTETFVEGNRTTPSPLSKNDPMGYGLIFHKILEDSVSNKDLAIMRTHPLIKTMNADIQKRLKVSIEKIIANEEFTKLIQKELKTEITLGTNAEDGIMIGRIDLMIIDQSEVFIIDYKSDHNIKGRFPEKYRMQLLSYKNIAEKIYPQKIIRTMILWLENGQLQEVY